MGIILWISWFAELQREELFWIINCQEEFFEERIHSQHWDLKSRRKKYSSLVGNIAVYLYSYCMFI